jgi:acetyl-CoA carboxylase biotin carboxyl carrier protein
MSTTKAILSPIPGVFYRKPGANDEEYVKEGQAVKVGETVGLIEVMKNFYEIKAEFDGVMEKFLVENEGLVDAGQEIAILKVDKND